MAGKAKGAQTIQMAERWQRVVRLMDEVYADYLSGMVALRKRVVDDMRRKLSDGEVLDRPDLEQTLPRERAAVPTRRPRARGRRPRG